MSSPIKELKKDSFVVTSKGNYGRIISIGKSTAMVKIGYKVHEIELYNIFDITDGVHLQVYYVDSSGTSKDTIVFIQHAKVIYNSKSSEESLLEVIKAAVAKKKSDLEITVTKVLIP